MPESSPDATWNRDSLPEGAEKKQAVRDMFDAIAPRYDMVNRIMTFRLDVRWRRRAVHDLALPLGSLVLDLASGTGDMCIDLDRSGHRPISMDLSFGMLSADRSGAPRVQADILDLPIADHAVDGVTCGFALRNLLELPAFFDELGRVVRSGGRLALLDVGVPTSKVVRAGTRDLLRQDRAEDRWTPLRPGGVPVPSQERCLSPRARRDGRCSASERVRRCSPHQPLRRHHPDAGGHPGLRHAGHHPRVRASRRPQRCGRQRWFPVRSRRHRLRRSGRGTQRAVRRSHT